MKTIILFSFFVFLNIQMVAQQIVNLPFESPSEFEWLGEERDYYSEHWETRVITNVSKPSLIVYKPKADINTGVSVIVGPGGGLYAHSIDSEGNWVADWLVKKGITVFVLKYRLVPYTGDAPKAFGDPNEKAEHKAKKLLPYAILDGLEAVDYVRDKSEEFNIDKDKVGFMGFSAGGSVTMGVTIAANNKQMPDFIVPVYAWMTIMDDFSVPKNAPPMLVICASDDPLGLAPMNVDLYRKWLDAGKKSALHMYSKGGHGFGMRTQNLASDNWIKIFYEWLYDEGFLKK